MKIKTSLLTKIAVISALNICLAILFVIPVPMTKGYVNFLEVGIYTSSFLFGPQVGGIVGAISGGGLDLLLGYPQWIIFSVVIHGVQGYLCGKFYLKNTLQHKIFSLVIASIWMIFGYFLATTFLYGSVAGIASIIGNIWQNIIGMIASVILSEILQRYLTSKA